MRFNTHHLSKAVTPRDVYKAVNHELDSTSTIVCIAELERNWYNVTFDNEQDCETIASQGLLLHNALVQCERANIRNSVIAYIKAPYEIPDNAITSLLSRYGTVANIRRQYHGFDDNIETGVRSCLVKSLKKPIPSFLKFSGFTLPVRYRGQQKTCKICEETGHLARDCPARNRCFVCGSYDHRAAWHDKNDNSEQDEIRDDNPANEHKENEEDTTGEKEDNEPQNTEPPAEDETHSSKAKKGEEKKGMDQTENTEQHPLKEAASKPKLSFKEVVAGTTSKKTPTKPQGFWDEAMNSQAVRKLSRKRKSTEASTASTKVARDESTPTDMETLAAENPVDETPENMHDQEHTDERSDYTYSEGSIDEDSGRTVDPDYHSEDPEDLGGEFTLYTRGGVRRRRKKRTSWERKSTTNNSQQTTSKTNDTDQPGPSSYPTTNKPSKNNESQPKQRVQQSQRGRGRGKLK